MKLKHISNFVILVLILWTSTACGASSPGASETLPTTTPPSLAAAQTARTNVVSAEGEVVPVKQVSLSFEATGQLVELLVSEGDTVEVGQVVARLDPTDWQQRVDEAQVALELAQAQLVQAKAGATAGDFAVAEAALATAQASLAQVKAGSRPEEIAAAQEALAAAQAGVSAAKANLDSAQAELAGLEAGATPEEITVAKANMDKAAVALELAQSEYDKISWQSGLGATNQAITLRQASDDYEIAKANYEALVKGATAEELDIARAAVEAARAQVDVARAQAGQSKASLDQLLAGPTAEDIAVAEAQVGEAQAQLVKLRERPYPEDIAVAEAQVRQAQTALEGARIALEEVVLVAPLAGTVGSVRVEEGELVVSGAQVIVIGDLTTLQIRTNDLSEIDVVRVAVGQKVEVTVDALPYLELRGRVNKIASMAQEQSGDIVYTVTIDLEEGLEADLRWGMTAYVDILVGE
ncbi:MAG: HlyD family efflux transporter periplasmic adaptor subunit [Anaerolineae bacterium]|nr:HlyD family efflux transporter periplasmic adaptor subunit [Anaerolineae bacterium]